MLGPLRKAKLVELEQPKDGPVRAKDGGKTATVQFNPELLKVSYSNCVKDPKSVGSQGDGSASRQFVGSGSTKLSLELWFDVTLLTGPDKVDDVRRLTGDVTYFMVPQPTNGAEDNLAPPLVRFAWGSFEFDGVIDSIEESLEFFSDQGLPLRAKISCALSQQQILKPAPSAGPRGDGPGTRPLFEAKAGGTLPDAAAGAGKADWQAVAQANGIEDPRHLAPGQLVDFGLPGLNRS